MQTPGQRGASALLTTVVVVAVAGASVTAVGSAPGYLAVLAGAAVVLALVWGRATQRLAVAAVVLGGLLLPGVLVPLVGAERSSVPERVLEVPGTPEEVFAVGGLAVVQQEDEAVVLGGEPVRVLARLPGRVDAVASGGDLLVGRDADGASTVWHPDGRVEPGFGQDPAGRFLAVSVDRATWTQRRAGLVDVVTSDRAGRELWRQAGWLRTGPVAAPPGEVATDSAVLIGARPHDVGGGLQWDGEGRSMATVPDAERAVWWGDHVVWLLERPRRCEFVGTVAGEQRWRTVVEACPLQSRLVAVGDQVVVTSNERTALTVDRHTGAMARLGVEPGVDGTVLPGGLVLEADRDGGGAGVRDLTVGTPLWRCDGGPALPAGDAVACHGGHSGNVFDRRHGRTGVAVALRDARSGELLLGWRQDRALTVPPVRWRGGWLVANTGRVEFHRDS